MQTVAQPRSTTQRRSEGGRYSARSTWYSAIEAEHIARIEAMEAQADVARLAQVVGDAVTALPEAAARITKAAALVQAKDVWPMSDGTFLVGSQSDTEKAYLVRRGPWTCECKAAQHQAGPCKHALAAMLTVKLGTAYQPTYQ
jgi:SWIM zinc finger